VTKETFDSGLIEAARQGDPVALKALVCAARPHVQRIARRRCLANADDAAQEALWIIHRKVPTLRSVAAFPAWLLRVVARICLGLVGPLWSRVEALKHEDATHAADALPLDLRIDLANAVDALPDTYRDTMLMHYYEDLPVAEIAVRLGISAAATKVRLHRGRDLLRRHLEGERASPAP
jgi:RNA polymerase sigma factor (sigma-70 family)